MDENHTHNFEIKIDINNAGDLRTLTIVSEGKVFSVLLNEINIAQLERSANDKDDWHIRFSNLSELDMKRVQEAINLHAPL